MKYCYNHVATVNVTPIGEYRRIGPRPNERKTYFSHIDAPKSHYHKGEKSSVFAFTAGTRVARKIGSDNAKMFALRCHLLHAAAAQHTIRYFPLFFYYTSKISQKGKNAI